MEVCGLRAPRVDNRNLTSPDLSPSWRRVCDPLVSGRQTRTKKLASMTARRVILLCEFETKLNQHFQPTIFEFCRGCDHVFANVSFLSLQMQKSELAKCRNMFCTSCVGDSQSLFIVLWEMRMLDLHVDVHRIAR